MYDGRHAAAPVEGAYDVCVCMYACIYTDTHTHTQVRTHIHLHQNMCIPSSQHVGPHTIEQVNKTKTQDQPVEKNSSNVPSLHAYLHHNTANQTCVFICTCLYIIYTHVCIHIYICMYAANIHTCRRTDSKVFPALQSTPCHKHKYAHICMHIYTITLQTKQKRAHNLSKN